MRNETKTIGIEKITHRKFTDQERKELRGYLADVAEAQEVIDDLEDICAAASGRQPDRAEKNIRIEKYLNAATDFQSTIEELKLFAGDNLQAGDSNDVYIAASQIQPHLIHLESLLESKKKFMLIGRDRRKQTQEKDHRPNDDHAAALVKSIAEVFLRHGMRPTKYRHGVFMSVVTLCFSAIGNPRKNPARIVNKILDHKSPQK